MTRRVAKEGASKTKLTTAGTSRLFNTRAGWASFFSEYMGPRVRVHKIELEGPSCEQWPPPSHVALFGNSAPTFENAEPILRRFASRAFRRPVTEEELTPLIKLVKARQAKGDPAVTALKAGLRGVLVSPGFLYLRETDGPLDGYSLASRLSYFLWSSMPDERLMGESGNLRDAATRRKQVLRMLADPKANAFVEQFTSRCKLGVVQDRFDAAESEGFSAVLRRWVGRGDEERSAVFLPACAGEQSAIGSFFGCRFTFAERRAGAVVPDSGRAWRRVPKSVVDGPAARRIAGHVGSVDGER